MRKGLFTEAQFIGILKQAEAGRMPSGVLLVVWRSLDSLTDW